MDKIKKFINRNYLLIFVLLIASFFQLLFLDRVPPGMSHDEVVYALSSKTFFLHGTDITGTGFPLGLFRTQTEGNISIFASILLSPLHLLYPLTQETARLPYVFFLFLSGVAVFLIARSLFENEKIGIIALLLFLFEPWSFFMSRFAAEPPIALIFYLWGIATVLICRGKKLVIPFLLFVLGFYSYHGGKILFLPLIALFLTYLFSKKKINKKEALYFFLGSLIVFISFFAISLSLPGGIVGERKNEIFFLNEQLLSSQVNTGRSIVLENPLTPFFVNKFTVSLDIFFQKYITAFSTKILFLQGDSRIFYSFIYHGLLYLFDAVFIPAGLLFLYVKQKKVFWLLLGLLLLAPLPSAVNGTEDSYINRASLLLIVFVLLSAYGCYHAFLVLSKKISQIATAFLFMGVMGIAIANFLFFYFLEYPRIVGDYYSLGERVTAEFIKRSWDSHKQFVVVQNEPGEMYLETVFFFQNERITTAFIDNIDKFNHNIYELPKITFRGDCPEEYDIKTVYIVSDIKKCDLPITASNWIKNPKDAGIIYGIYNSNFCKNYASSNWLRFHFISDYDIESMSSKSFCERWISSVPKE